MWIIVAGRNSWEKEFGVYKVDRETAQRYYYTKTYEQGHTYRVHVKKSAIVGRFEAREQAVEAIERAVEVISGEMAIAMAVEKDLREKLSHAKFEIAVLKDRRREMIASAGIEGVNDV